MEASSGRARGRDELILAFARARESGDAGLMEEAAVRLPSSQRFGAHPGQVPALVHEAYAAATSPASRCRLAGALARAWVYGGDAGRALPFADEAVDLARRIGDPGLAADAFDAALLARWGPDDFDDRLRLSAELADAAAHLAEPELRLSAHLWRLTTAWECLDIVAVRRQLRALDLLAEETGDHRAAYFAASRRAMHALVTADLAVADRLIASVAEIGAGTDEPDQAAVGHSLAAARARRAGDTAALMREAAAFEEYGAAEAVPSVLAEAAVLWLEAGEPDRALGLASQVAGGGLDGIARDVDFLLTVASLAQVGTAAGHAGIAGDGIRLLQPFAGRAVLNAGAVTFHGVTDDYLFRACEALGRPEARGWRDAAALCYRRVGASWWQDRLGGPPAAATVPARVYLSRDQAGGWIVGRAGATAVLPDLRGLRYLRYLVERPGAEIGAQELAAAASGRAVIREPAGAEVADRQALAAYRRRLGEIDDELAEARALADEGRLGPLSLEREALLSEVRSATGLSGRPRRFTAADERARVAVRKAVAAVLSRIERHDAGLARLLRDTVRTGGTCSYEPDPARPVTWLLGARSQGPG